MVPGDALEHVFGEQQARRRRMHQRSHTFASMCKTGQTRNQRQTTETCRPHTPRLLIQHMEQRYVPHDYNITRTSIKWRGPSLGARTRPGRSARPHARSNSCLLGLSSPAQVHHSDGKCRWVQVVGKSSRHATQHGRETAHRTQAQRVHEWRWHGIFWETQVQPKLCVWLGGSNS